MSVSYNDAASALHILEEEAGDTPATTRPVHGLPDDVKANLAAIEVATEAVSALIAGGKLPVVDTALAGHVDGIETLLTTLNGYVDGIETLLTALNGYVDGLEGSVDQLEGYLDGVETLITSTNTKLDTLHTDLGTTLAGYLDQLEGYLDTVETKLADLHTDLTVAMGNSYGQGSVGSSATQIASGASLATKFGVRIKNLHATQDLYVGYDSSTSNTTGVKLRPGEEAPFPVANRSTLYLYGSAGSTTYCYWTA